MRRDHNLINSYWKQGCPFTEVFTVVANKKFGTEKPVPKYRRFWMFFGTRNQKKMIQKIAKIVPNLVPKYRRF